MKYRVVYLDEAKLDLKDIVAYLAQYYKSTARAFKEKVAERVNALKEWPLMCQVYALDPYFRQMVVGDYLLFYSVDEEKRLVAIHRIVHQKRDASKVILTRRPLE